MGQAGCNQCGTAGRAACLTPWMSCLLEIQNATMATAVCLVQQSAAWTLLSSYRSRSMFPEYAMSQIGSGVNQRVSTSGKTLLGMLNHVLDYSKVIKFGRAQMRKNAKQTNFVNVPSDSNLSRRLGRVIPLANARTIAGRSRIFTGIHRQTQLHRR